MPELNSPIPCLPRYRVYGFPQDTAPPAYAAVYVDKKFAHTQFDTQPWYLNNGSIMGCQIQLMPKRIMIVFSVFTHKENMRTQTKHTKADFTYTQHFEKIYPNDTILICNDFNAQHVAWNYKKCSPRRTMEVLTVNSNTTESTYRKPIQGPGSIYGKHA